MIENQGPVTGTRSQAGHGRRGTEARTRDLRVRGVETCQGDRRAGRAWAGLGSKRCSGSWLSKKGRGDRSASPGKVRAVQQTQGQGCGAGERPCGSRRVWGHRARSVRLQRRHRAVTAAGPPLTAHVAAPEAAACRAAAAAAASAAAELLTDRESARPARWPRPGSRAPRRPAPRPGTKTPSRVEALEWQGGDRDFTG